METLEFAPSLYLGVDVIDQQHGRFFDLMNKLMAADSVTNDRKLVGGIIGELAAYVVDHFCTEEELMERFGYPDLREHQLKHARFAAHVEAYHAKFERGEVGLEHELLAYLVNWYTDHIRVEDTKCAELFKANGI